MSKGNENKVFKPTVFIIDESENCSLRLKQQRNIISKTTFCGTRTMYEIFEDVSNISTVLRRAQKI
jgi:hypothetical protein